MEIIKENKKSSIKKNYIFNLVYHIFALITPLIVTPYISRVLKSDGVGRYSFTYSIITYFVLFGALGFSLYAQREIARFQDNRYEQTKIFWEIIVARLITVFASLIVHAALILTKAYGENYTFLMLVLSINIISCAFDISFFFIGNERFILIALSSVTIKALGVVLIIVFVKNESDVWLYALFQMLIVFFSNIILWLWLPKMLVKIDFRALSIKRHFLPSLHLFVPTIAASVYTMLDKTLIGVMIQGVDSNTGKLISEIENGYYDHAEKIVKLVLTIITSLGIVMLPRNSHILSAEQNDEFKSNINLSLRFVFFIGLPISCGLAAVAFNFSPWFFGDGYEKVPYLIIVLCPLVLFIGLSNVLGIQYLLPKKRDKFYTISIVSGAAINIVLNLALIIPLRSFGAAISTVIAELLIAILMAVFSRKEINLFKSIGKSWRYFIGAFLMFTSVFLTQRFLKPSILNTFVLIAEGIFVYFVVLLVLKDDFLYSYFFKLFKRKKRKDISDDTI